MCSRAQIRVIESFAILACCRTRLLPAFAVTAPRFRSGKRCLHPNISCLSCVFHRWYFGNHVGFYLSFLNAMTVWLLAPAVVSLYLSLAVRSSSTGSSTGTTASTATADAVSNPLVPILLVFHLLWSAAGLKLWRRHEAGLNHKWYQTANRSSSSGSSTTVGSSSSRERSLNETPNHGQNHPQDPSLQPVSGHTTATVDRSAVAAAPAGPKDTASATAAAATVIGRLPGDNVALPLAGAAGTDTVFSDRWGGGVPVASLVTPAASGVRREYTGAPVADG